MKRQLTDLQEKYKSLGVYWQWRVEERKRLERLIEELASKWEKSVK
jgi:hypothetical protein